MTSQGVRVCERKMEKETDCECRQGSQCETPACTVTSLLLVNIWLGNNKACVSKVDVYLVLVQKNRQKKNVQNTFVSYHEAILNSVFINKPKHKYFYKKHENIAMWCSYEAVPHSFSALSASGHSYWSAFYWATKKRAFQFDSIWLSICNTWYMAEWLCFRTPHINHIIVESISMYRAGVNDNKYDSD